ncbi:MAG: hypothetical protein ABFS46_16585 [Myxococcota bacterium]
MATQDQEYREAVKERYRFSEWAGTVRGDAAVRRQNVELPDFVVGGWTIERAESLTERIEGVVAATRYVYAQDEAARGRRVMVRVYEYDSPLASHEGLIDVVMTLMAPSLPTCADLGIEAGDVCFGSRGDPPTGAVFSRYNVLVHVESIGARPVSVAPFVQAVDAILDEAP